MPNGLKSTVRRGTVLTFDPSAWTAQVLLDGADAESQIPVGQWVPSGMLAAEAEVAVLIFGGTNTDDAVVLGPYGAVSAWDFPAIGSAANGQLLIGNGAGMALAALSGTANRVTVSSGAGSITLSTPQDLHTGAAVIFGQITGLISDAATSTQVIPIALAHRTSGTPAAGFGVHLLLEADSDNNSLRSQALFSSSWSTAADATRKARVQLYVSDSGGNREYLRGEADGSGPRIGFLGSTAAARPGAYTQAYATATRTHSNPTASTPSAYAGGANGYSTAAKAQELRDQIAALVADVANIKQVLNSVIDDLQAYGLLA